MSALGRDIAGDLSAARTFCWSKTRQNVLRALACLQSLFDSNRWGGGVRHRESSTDFDHGEGTANLQIAALNFTVRFIAIITVIMLHFVYICNLGSMPELDSSDCSDSHIFALICLNMLYNVVDCGNSQYVPYNPLDHGHSYHCARLWTKFEAGILH